MTTFSFKDIFWTLWEELPEEIKDEYCEDTEADFYLFKNQINSLPKADVKDILIELIEKKNKLLV